LFASTDLGDIEESGWVIDGKAMPDFKVGMDSTNDTLR